MGIHGSKAVVWGWALAFLILGIQATPSPAQSLNVAIGPTMDQPSSDYGAAGQPGFWNATPAANGTTTYDLHGLDGVETDVYVTQFGGTELRIDEDPATSGDDDTLMDSCLVTHNSVENCLFFYDMDNGTYEVLVYAWMPNTPEVMSYTNSDEEVGNPHHLVGGEWPGQHEQWVTYARHISIVGPPNMDGRLRVHSGLAPGGSPFLGAALNGVQIRRLADGDLNYDDTVGAVDLAMLLGSWGPCSGICPADLNFDGTVGAADLAILLGNWG